MTFKVALSADFQKPDGTLAFPSFDLSPLDADPDVEWAFIPVSDGRIAADDIAGYDALILLIPRFDADSFPGDGRLSVIARFGVGYDTVDVKACSANGTALVITPGGVRRPVATCILTFLLALSTNLLVKDRLTRRGPDGWAERANHMGTGLVGRTLGSLGLGNIGAELFRLAAPLDMRFIAHDPYADAQLAAELNVELVGLDELFRRSDILSVNCPLNDETRGIVNAERLALMQPSACLINTARGPIVDEAALIEALDKGVIAGAALDVFEQEPSAADNALTGMGNVILTPHSLCFTDQCFANIGAADIAAVLDVKHGRVPTGIVNAEITDDPGWRDKLTGYRAKYGEG